MLLVEPETLLQACQRFADLDHLPLGLAVVDSNLTVLYWNETLAQWTGTSRTTAQGKPLGELNPEWALPHYAERLSHLFTGGPPVVFSPVLHPRLVVQEPGERCFNVKASSVPEGNGGWWAFISVEDVSTLWKRLEELRVLRIQQDRLMREIHHRVKNNLNMISGLVTLQKCKIDDGSDQAPLDDLQSRIAAISEIHDILYQSTNLMTADTATYLENLARLLDSSLSPAGDHRLILDLDPNVSIKTDTTVLLGLIQAELVTNALKYGIGEGPDEELTIRLRRVGHREWEYSLSHTGDRLPADFNPSTSRGLGMVLLTAYADQMGSRLEWHKGNPTRFWLRFTS